MSIRRTAPPNACGGKQLVPCAHMFATSHVHQQSELLCSPRKHFRFGSESSLLHIIPLLDQTQEIVLPSLRFPSCNASSPNQAWSASAQMSFVAWPLLIASCAPPASRITNPSVQAWRRSAHHGWCRCGTCGDCHLRRICATCGDSPPRRSSPASAQEFAWPPLVAVYTFSASPICCPSVPGPASNERTGYRSAHNGWRRGCARWW